MNYTSVFDIIGPIMVGPSSSHTAGAARMGKTARNVLGGTPKDVKIYLYGSFADTYKGHGTDLALMGGLLGFETDNEDIPKSLDIAKEKNISVEFITSDEKTNHPNTAKLAISNDIDKVDVTCISVGGGVINTININGHDVTKFKTGTRLLVRYTNKDLLSQISNVLNSNAFNTEIINYKDSKTNICLITSNEKIKEDIVNIIKNLDSVIDVLGIN